MNRNMHQDPSQVPMLLAKASDISERAARAMCPDAGPSALAITLKCNVITLQNNDISSIPAKANLDGDGNPVVKDQKGLSDGQI